jgi:uncharacterized membrane protein (UPF0127 family)
MRRARVEGTVLGLFVEPAGVGQGAGSGSREAGGPRRAIALVNERTGETLAREVEPALDSATRRKGLLGRDGLAPATAMILAPCPSIHTFFMRFPIDVLFTDRQGRVLKALPAVPAWRLAMARRAFAAVELPAGVIARTQTTAGDRLVLKAEG